MNMWTAEKVILLGFLLKGVECIYIEVTLPKNIDALSGSCVLINCTFKTNISISYETPEALWIVNKIQKIVFNSSRSSPVFKGSIIGKLKENNCTTIFYDISSNHSGTYYFIDKTQQDIYKYNVFINVTESPPPPTVMLYTEMKKLQYGPVLEGSSVILRCSAKTLCSSSPPVLTWSSNPKLHLSESSRLLKLQNQTELISDLNFNVTHLHHRVDFICTITYQLQDKNKTAQTIYKLDVKYAPRISASSSCNRADGSVCFCEAHGNPFPNLAWYLSERPVTNSTCTSISEERLGGTALRSTFIISHFFTTEHTVQCVATNIFGNASHEFHLDPLSTVTSYYDHKTLSLLITLVLILLLYALTVGAGLYKIKQLSTKLKAKGKAEAEAHASVQRSASNNIYENLNF